MAATTTTAWVLDLLKEAPREGVQEAQAHAVLPRAFIVIHTIHTAHITEHEHSPHQHNTKMPRSFSIEQSQLIEEGTAGGGSGMGGVSVIGPSPAAHRTQYGQYKWATAVLLGVASVVALSSVFHSTGSSSSSNSNTNGHVLANADKELASQTIGSPPKMDGFDRPYITLFGDSHTQYGWSVERGGFAALLAEAYNRYADIRNRGVSGYTTRDALKVLDLVFPLDAHSSVRAYPPSLVLILLGSNDQVAPGQWVDAHGDHHVPLDEYKANYAQIIRHLQELDAALPILLLAPPPVETTETRQNTHMKKYRDAVLELGEVEELPVVDLWTVCEGDDDEEYLSYLVDGLHFNAKGNKAVFEAILEKVGEAYPELLPGGEGMPKRQKDPSDPTFV